jgi:hypothetical protein
MTSLHPLSAILSALVVLLISRVMDSPAAMEGVEDDTGEVAEA